MINGQRPMTPDELVANGYPRNFHALSLEERLIATKGALKKTLVKTSDKQEPYLGLATTAQLLEEIRVRIELDYFNVAVLKYTSVDGRPDSIALDPVSDSPEVMDDESVKLESVIRNVLNYTEVEHIITNKQVDQLTSELVEAINKEKN